MNHKKHFYPCINKPLLKIESINLGGDEHEREREKERERKCTLQMSVRSGKNSRQAAINYPPNSQHSFSLA